MWIVLQTLIIFLNIVRIPSQLFPSDACVQSITNANDSSFKTLGFGNPRENGLSFLVFKCLLPSLPFSCLFFFFLLSSFTTFLFFPPWLVPHKSLGPSCSQADRTCHHSQFTSFLKRPGLGYHWLILGYVLCFMNTNKVHKSGILVCTFLVMSCLDLISRDTANLTELRRTHESKRIY